MGMKSKIALGAVVGIVVIGAASANSGDSDGGSADTSTSASAEQRSGDTKQDGASDAKPAEDKGTEKASQAEQFKAFVRKNGTPQEKDAASHVTKVQGADEQNDILDAADIYTDFTGGIMGEGMAPAKLLTSAFADWKQSDNGLVTVYDADGELLGTGNF
ncbi:hypothetical protein [Streptomyces sp. SAI-229]|uniref:hypothetical protein n=1 Tax=Streptomyces sp. SAI-229 TaxID=3377731 RepID=UPI003C7A7CD8